MNPPRRRVAVVSWLAIYPTITLVLPALEAIGLNDLALPLRTLAISVVVVPTVVYVVSPALTRLLQLPGMSPSDPGRERLRSHLSARRQPRRTNGAQGRGS